jgi:hypothetical protein
LVRFWTLTEHRHEPVGAVERDRFHPGLDHRNWFQVAVPACALASAPVLLCR